MKDDYQPRNPTEVPRPTLHEFQRVVGIVLRASQQINREKKEQLDP